MYSIKLNYHLIAGIILAILAAAALIECDRQTSGRRVQSVTSGNFKSPCGSSEEVAARVGRCLDPIFELVEGRFIEPKGDDDILTHCQRFNSSERCIRTISKDCLTGIHKTAVGAVASATKRFRSSECKSEQTRSKYIEPLKCAKGTGKSMANLYRSYTSMVQNIRDQPIGPDQKLLKVCCALIALDKDIEILFDQACPKSTAAILSIEHAMTDDARSTLCLNPKCAGVIDASMKKSSLKQNQNFVEPIMQVLFSLSD